MLHLVYFNGKFYFAGSGYNFIDFFFFDIQLCNIKNTRNYLFSIVVLLCLVEKYYFLPKYMKCVCI